MARTMWTAAALALGAVLTANGAASADDTVRLGGPTKKGGIGDFRRFCHPTYFDRRKRMAGKRLTKAQVIAELANATDLDKKSVNRVFEGLQELIRKQLSARGPGEFVVPGLVKLRVVKKPATKERQGINPFTKEPITIPAKPASKKVRATALKALKDLVQ